MTQTDEHSVFSPSTIAVIVAAGIIMVSWFQVQADLKKVRAWENRVYEYLDRDPVLSMFDQHPWPAWIKGADGRMVWINRAYTEQWGIKLSDYVGRSDYEVWPHEIADRFQENDDRVMMSKQPFLTYEDVDDGIYEIQKFPLIRGGNVYAIAGFSTKRTIREPKRKFDENGRLIDTFTEHDLN